jgi:hypothetical protein
LKSDFARDGFAVLPAQVGVTLLRPLDTETRALVDAAAHGPPPGCSHPADFLYADGPASATPVLRRVEYVVDKLAACRRLLAAGWLADLVGAIQGPDSIPTWDSMVVKMPGDGVTVPWHRDASRHQVSDGPPIFNADIYLDDADEHTAVWAIPGSHRLRDRDAQADASRRNHNGFGTDGAVRLPMRAGDVLLHDIRLLHGSPPSVAGGLRRVVYFEFRPVATELAIGPHTAAYVDRKRTVLDLCRRGIEPELGALRVAHEEYWRT